MRAALGLVLLVTIGFLAWQRLGGMPTQTEALSPLVEPQLDGLAEEDRQRIRQQLLEVSQADPSDSDFLGQAYGDLGRLYLAFDLRDAALPALRNAATLQPGDARWSYYLGHLASSTGDHSAALQHFEAARARDSQSVAVVPRLASTLIELGRLSEAEDLLTSAIADLQGEPYAFALLGRIAAEDGDDRSAVLHYETALRLDPTATSLYYPLSQSYRALGEVGKAEAALAQRGSGPASIFDDPWMRELYWVKRSTEARLSQASELMGQGRFEEAAAVYRDAVQEQPDSATAQRGLGAALLSLGQLEAAQEALETALALEPGNPKSLYNLALIQLQLGQVDSAESSSRQALDSDPYDPAMLRFHAQLLRTSGRCDEAINRLATALGEAPNQVELQRELLLCQLAIGDAAAALSTVESAVALQPADPALRLILARILAAAPEDEVRDGRRALEIAEALLAGMRSAEALEAAAMAQAELGRFDEASALQREALAAVPADERPAWFGFLQENLARYQRGEPCRQPWPPFMAGD